MTAPSPSPLYLDVEGTPTFAVIHRPSAARNGPGVVFCPPFGWEEVCSYRVLREWASRLAASGHPALRLTLPSCGDSGGDPRDPGRLAAWIEAVAQAARLMRAEPGVAGVVVVGLGLGGIIACRAAAAGAPIDGLVLWATPARGRTIVRQLRAFSRIEAAQTFDGLPDPPPLSDGELEAGGFLLTAQTQADLGAVDLSALSFPRGLQRGVLLLDQDGIGIDERLRGALAARAVGVTVAPGHGYATMTSHPQQAQLPEQVLARVDDWLHASGGHPSSELTRTPHPGDDVPAPGARALLEHDGAQLIETPIEIPTASGSASGILATPASGEQDLCMVLLNAGAIRRIGPNRMWVEAARRWAARGIASLRLDVEGIGDADGAVAPYTQDSALYVPELIPQVTTALDAVQRRGIANRFALAGLCGGAYWSLHAALDDSRVSACVMFNPRALVYDSGLAPSRDLRRLFAQPLSWERLRRNVTAPRVRAVLRWLAGIVGGRLARRGRQQHPSLADRTSIIIERLLGSPLRAVLVFSAHEPLEEELVSGGWMDRLERADNVRVERIAVRDHTLRPCFAQAGAHAALDRAVERERVPAASAR
jgi:dienelactone hydrolase